ncbi:3'-phosphoadenosine 5'-phosphosulfate (PAPS) 3'-phosphatase [Rivularia sp. PCC 7116]|uniref:3'(2'),5'-bisphosphate nucleotidase CysQ family protein n=1 Tax=Rivularia sp. PCC 7116 TaxID=373994 RepID=UPI00029EEB53|nr:3'(2'),5'-bisphosphate nucleotidase CysQ [Rivularia sp. PCC 7116]AFY54458.1 3'-phosphoadenosine 5'-phosphosulfate (PAPS) 3'-phosphatase [Rivularia sp. PCC 7116]
MKDLQSILELIRPISWGASDILRSYYRGEKQDDLNIEYKDNKGKDPVTEADLAVNSFILQKLQSELSGEDFGYISEETYQNQDGKNNSEWVWIIDPLDGTKDFINKTGEYAIHIALVRNKRPELALVAIPEAEKLYYAIKGGGTFVETRDGERKSVRVSERDNPQDLTLVVSRSHRNEKLNFLLSKLPCQNQKSVGSVGGKIVTIIEQQADIYISLSGKSAPKDWDMAAPELILTEAGGNYTHFDGTPLQYNTGDINQWGGLLASNGKCHEMLCKEAERILQDFS